MTLPPCYVSKFLIEANSGGTGDSVVMLMRERDIALNFSRTVGMWLAAILIDMLSSPAQHVATKIGAPFFAMPIAFAPLALHGKFFIGLVPQAVNCFNHSQNVSGGIRG